PSSSHDRIAYERQQKELAGYGDPNPQTAGAIALATLRAPRQRDTRCDRGREGTAADRDEGGLRDQEDGQDARRWMMKLADYPARHERVHDDADHHPRDLRERQWQ